MAEEITIPEKGDKLYEGKAKILYATSDPDMLIQFFKDDASAFNAKKKGSIHDKGIMNNAVSTAIYKYLEENDVKTHLVSTINEREQLILRSEVIPVEVIMRNRVAGSLARRMGRTEGEELNHPILEFCYKDDDLDDPMINADYLTAFGLGTAEELDIITAEAKKINVLLVAFFKERGIDLIDFKLEFGRHKGRVVLVDEISADSCRLWDAETGEKLDKDRFRHDLGRIEESYGEVVTRVTGVGK